MMANLSTISISFSAVYFDHFRHVIRVYLLKHWNFDTAKLFPKNLANAIDFVEFSGNHRNLKDKLTRLSHGITLPILLRK